MAFQANAFQSDAFQISASQIALQRRRAKRREERDAQRRYEEARNIIEQVQQVMEVTEIKAQLEDTVTPFKKDNQIDMAELMSKGFAKRRLEQILTSIRQLEDELLMILALLLLANEEL